MSEGGKPAFPKARYVMWKDDWDFWTAEGNLEKLTAGQMYGEAQLDQFIGACARKNLLPIQGQLELVEHETEIVPDVQAAAAPGAHTRPHGAGHFIGW